MRVISGNQNLILLCERDTDAFSCDENSPYVVLVSTREISSADSFGVERFYDFLRKIRAEIVLCVGEDSEELHDILDGFFEMDESVVDCVVTTYHDDESIEDVANLFLHGVVLYNVKNTCFLVVAGARDNKLIEALEHA